MLLLELGCIIFSARSSLIYFLPSCLPVPQICVILAYVVLWHIVVHNQKRWKCQD